MTTIGIDLGTTNSLVAYWTEEGPVMIPNALGSTLTPSVVSVDDNNEILIGEIAKERLITHPHMTAAIFKRAMGTEKIFQLGKFTFTPQELSSFIIKALKEDAEVFLGHGVTEAVISVPAYFNDSQRKATKQAAELAGLKVERLISEPTAAAIAYGLHQKELETQFLVFDLGGGTFDVSILELFEGVMEVKSIAGDNFLGGEDFTDVLASYFIESQNIDINQLDAKARSLINKQAEQCKLALGQSQSASMTTVLNGQTYEVKLDRMDFEKICYPLLLRLRKPIERALNDASLSTDELDSVILIGGATRMPVIKSVISKMFGKFPYSHINPDEAVAMGAAIQVALKERNEALKEMVLTDVCPYSLGIDLTKNLGGDNYESGYFDPIIERNTPIPVSKVERYCTIRDNQTTVRFQVYQGESRRVENNIKLGEISISVPAAPAGQPIDVRYTYDINGILEVEIVVINTGSNTRAIIEKNPGTMTAEEIDLRFQALKDLKIHPRERTENRLLLARGERLYEESIGEKRHQISRLMEAFEAMLLTQNNKEVKKAAEKLKSELDFLERWRDF
ncbi:Hsp70 family protein [Paenibacillus sp. MMS18-CY102]|uniref:Hsp70 family protein n=1 Tax=Paenibacillus sp. MMS18-CY102 TaxID=2682849 RepID=UPI0013666F96|nr:Hsp70 family protein [Paenibacillus sp. MMS18-CY102]